MDKPLGVVDKPLGVVGKPLGVGGPLLGIDLLEGPLGRPQLGEVALPQDNLLVADQAQGMLLPGVDHLDMLPVGDILLLVGGNHCLTAQAHILLDH